MRWFVLAEIVVFGSLFIATTFASSPSSQEAAREVGFSETEIETGKTYAAERRLLFWCQTAFQLGIWTWIVARGFGRGIADTCLNLARNRWLIAVALVGIFCFLIEEAITFPFAAARLMHMWAWGMTQRSFASWAGEHFMQSAVFGLIELPVLVVGYWLIRNFPRTWWLLATAGATAFAYALALLLPIVVSPLFNTFTPLRESSWQFLEPRIKALLSKADIAVDDILVMDASRQSGHTNAYFAGFGPTRRIVLYDTLLRKHTPEEIETIVAHEIGHWQYDHILKGLALAGLGSMVGFFALWLILRWLVDRPPLYLQSPWDPAALPLILLLAMLSTWAALPVQNAISREFERQADRVSLELAGQADAFIAAERKLAIDNKMNVAPIPFSVWFFASHPPVVERMRMGMEWKPKGE